MLNQNVHFYGKGGEWKMFKNKKATTELIDANLTWVQGIGDLACLRFDTRNDAGQLRRRFECHSVRQDLLYQIAPETNHKMVTMALYSDSEFFTWKCNYNARGIRSVASSQHSREVAKYILFLSTTRNRIFCYEFEAQDRWNLASTQENIPFSTDIIHNIPFSTDMRQNIRTYMQLDETEKRLMKGEIFFENEDKFFKQKEYTICIWNVDADGNKQTYIDNDGQLKYSYCQFKFERESTRLKCKKFVLPDSDCITCDNNGNFLFCIGEILFTVSISQLYKPMQSVDDENCCTLQEWTERDHVFAIVKKKIDRNFKTILKQKNKNGDPSWFFVADVVSFSKSYADAVQINSEDNVVARPTNLPLTSSVNKWGFPFPPNTEKLHLTLQESHERKEVREEVQKTIASMVRALELTITYPAIAKFYMPTSENDSVATYSSDLQTLQKELLRRESENVGRRPFVTNSDQMVDDSAVDFSWQVHDSYIKKLLFPSNIRQIWAKDDIIFVHLGNGQLFAKGTNEFAQLGIGSHAKNDNKTDFCLCSWDDSLGIKHLFIERKNTFILDRSDEQKLWVCGSQADATHQGKHKKVFQYNNGNKQNHSSCTVSAFEAKMQAYILAYKKSELKKDDLLIMSNDASILLPDIDIEYTCNPEFDLMAIQSWTEQETYVPTVENETYERLWKDFVKTKFDNVNFVFAREYQTMPEHLKTMLFMNRHIASKHGTKKNETKQLCAPYDQTMQTFWQVNRSNKTLFDSSSTSFSMQHIFDKQEIQLMQSIIEKGQKKTTSAEELKKQQYDDLTSTTTTKLKWQRIPDEYLRHLDLAALQNYCNQTKFEIQQQILENKKKIYNLFYEMQNDFKTVVVTFQKLQDTVQILQAYMNTKQSEANFQQVTQIIDEFIAALNEINDLGFPYTIPSFIKRHIERVVESLQYFQECRKILKCLEISCKHFRITEKNPIKEKPLTKMTKEEPVVHEMPANTNTVFHDDSDESDHVVSSTDESDHAVSSTDESDHAVSSTDESDHVVSSTKRTQSSKKKHESLDAFYGAMLQKNIRPRVSNPEIKQNVLVDDIENFVAVYNFYYKNTTDEEFFKFIPQYRVQLSKRLKIFWSQFRHLTASLKSCCPRILTEFYAAQEIEKLMTILLKFDGVTNNFHAKFVTFYNSKQNPDWLNIERFKPLIGFKRVMDFYYRYAGDKTRTFQRNELFDTKDKNIIVIMSKNELEKIMSEIPGSLYFQYDDIIATTQLRPATCQICAVQRANVA
jgi:hypothetical protein